MNDAKIINDPVFGFIKIPQGLLLNIVQHPLMQRLTRIKQLGMANVVYPAAQHTRFQHSIGAFHLMSEAVSSLMQKGIFIFDSEAEAIEAWNGRADDHFRGATKMVERTAKVRPLVMGWEGVCTNCGAYTIHEMDYCHKCGARLEWE